MKLLLVIAGKWICELGTLFLLGRFLWFFSSGTVRQSGLVSGLMQAEFIFMSLCLSTVL